MDLGKKVRNLRSTSGLSLREFAEKASMSKTFLSDIEHGRGTPSIAMVENIARAAGIPLWRFFIEDDEGPTRASGRRSGAA
jgi:transcriptional regulator with XRE-family HTH domain